jgi:hypothetical protein
MHLLRMMNSTKLLKRRREVVIKVPEAEEEEVEETEETEVASRVVMMKKVVKGLQGLIKVVIKARDLIKEIKEKRSHIRVRRSHSSMERKSQRETSIMMHRKRKHQSLSLPRRKSCILKLNLRHLLTGINSHSDEIMIMIT